MVSINHPRKPVRQHLPGVLDEIAEVAGVETALKIAAIKGGTRVYIPLSPPEGHWLVEICGLDVARKIGSQLSAGNSGMEHVIPLGPHRTQATVWRTVRRMGADGISRNAIARSTGIHYKTVQRIINGKRKTVDQVLAQGDFFDGL